MQRKAYGVVNPSGDTVNFSLDANPGKGFLYTTSGGNVDIYAVWRVNEQSYSCRIYGTMELISVSISGNNFTVTSKKDWVNYSVFVF